MVFRGRFPAEAAALTSALLKGGPKISYGDRCQIHRVGTPLKIKGWNLQLTDLEGKMIFQTSMIMFHVNLQGCIHFVRLQSARATGFFVDSGSFNCGFKIVSRKFQDGVKTI